MTSTIKIILFFVVSLIANTLSAQSEDSNSSFVKFVAGSGEWQGELQTAIVSYENSDGVIVDLVSAVHLGEVEYYAELNDYFKQQDAVLYELVAYEDDRPSPETVIENVSAVSFLQRTLGNFLDVSFQLEQIDYSPENFIHADLNPDELMQIMEEKNENFFSMFLSLATAQLASEQAAMQQGEAPTSFTMLAIVNALLAEDQTAAFKYLFAEELGRSDGLIVGPELENQITILGDRNRVALQVLGKSLKDPSYRKISIFYGAAHMPGIERELFSSFDFERTEQSWVTAWKMP
ncbi:MAG: hypothetical protein GKR91_18275 [Pseudomonadales bacterium]|nr:hypothetical protein [Pseudomonadales bacterium]